MWGRKDVWGRVDVRDVGQGGCFGEEVGRIAGGRGRLEGVQKDRRGRVLVGRAGRMLVKRGEFSAGGEQSKGWAGSMGAR